MRLLLLFFLIANSAFAQNLTSDTTATIITYWAAGDTQSYSVTSTQKNFENNVLTKDSKNSHTVTFTVLEETLTGYIVEAYFEDYINDSDLFPNGLKAVYTTDDLGVYTSLINYKELKDSMNVAYDRLVEQSSSSQVKEIINNLRKTATSEASIEYILLEDLQVFHNPFGNEYTLGGDNFPGIMFIELTELEPKKDHCQLVIDQKIDNEKSSEIITEIFNSLVEATDTDVKTGNLDQLLIDDVYTFDMILETGWMEKINYTRTYIIQDVKQIKTLEMTLIEQ